MKRRSLVSYRTDWACGPVGEPDGDQRHHSALAGSCAARKKAYQDRIARERARKTPVMEWEPLLWEESFS